MEFIILLPLFSLIAIVVIEIIWSKTTRNITVTDRMIAKRKHIRYTEISIFLLFGISAAYVSEWLTDEVVGIIYAFLFVGGFLGQYRSIFEPYYDITIIPDLSEFTLYLRPFKLDRQSIIQKRNGFVKKFFILPEKLEKVICAEVRKKIGVVYSIGDPNTATPSTMEASSIYANDSNWQDAVTEMCSKAKTIILRIGDSEGSKWEILHCLKNNYISKTIFIADDYEDIIFLAEHSNINFPTSLYEHDYKRSSVGIFIKGSVCKFKELDSKKSCLYFIKDYLQEFPERVKLKLKLKNILQAKSASKWWDRLSLIVNPFAYIRYNRWHPYIMIIFCAYMLTVLWYLWEYICEIVNDYYELIGALLIIGLPIMLFMSIPWLWFAPKYSVALNSWGGVKISAKANKILGLWMTLYVVLNIIGIAIIW